MSWQVRNLERHERVLRSLRATGERKRRVVTHERVRRYWSAELVSGEKRLPVDTRHGAWMVTLPDGTRRHLTSEAAMRLQARVRPIERREQKEAEAAAKAAAKAA